MPHITFTNEDFKNIEWCHNDPMAVKIEVANFLECKVLLNNESSTNVLYWFVFKKLVIPKSQIEPFPEQLIGFCIGDNWHNRIRPFVDNFQWRERVKVHHDQVPPNRCMHLIQHTYKASFAQWARHYYFIWRWNSLVKVEKIIYVLDDQIIARECYTASLRIGKGKNVIEPKSQLVECTSLNSNLGEAELDPWEAEPRVEPTEKAKPESNKH